MKRNYKLKVLLYIDTFFLCLLIIYKIYLYFFEIDYEVLNVNSINKIKSDTSQPSQSFAVIGNINNSISVFEKKIIPMLNKEDINFVVALGNSVADGSEDKYRMLYTSIAKLNHPFINTLGVNEVSDDGLKWYYRHFGPFCFSFASKKNFFIFIDTTGNTSALLLKSWLISELKFSRKFDNVFVFMNKPIYVPKNILHSGLLEKYINDEDLRSFLIKSFSKYNVKAVFSSNIGILDTLTIENVRYFITGGGGGFIRANSNNFFHYIKVNIGDNNNISYSVVKINYESTNPILRQIENLWLFIHSIFYITMANFFIVILFLSAFVVYLYYKINEDIDYYDDFMVDFESVPIKKPLTVAMFTNNYFPFIGGVPIAISRLAKGLVAASCKVYIFAPYFKNYRDENSEINIIRCKTIGKYKKFYDVPVVNIFSPTINSTFKKLNIDVVHLHHPFWMGKKGLRLAESYDCPAVLTYHTRFEKYAHYVPFIGGKLFKNILSHFIVKNFSKKCDLIIAPTYDAKEYLRNIGIKTPVEIIPTGVDFEAYSKVNVSELLNLRDIYKKDNQFILLTVSRLTKEKNLSFLIKGIKYLNDNYDINFKLFIIGSGEEESYLFKFIKENNLADQIVLLGSVDVDNICKYYVFSDIFLFASTTETQGLVILEAMAGGCPVVAVRSSGIDDIVINGYNGFKTQENIISWAEKIYDLTVDQALYNKLSKNACEFSKNYSIDVLSRKVAKIYSKLLYDKEKA